MNWNMSMTDKERKRFQLINKENIDFLRWRYNKINRWVIADIIKRNINKYHDKPALISQDTSLTYAQLERECNKFANALLEAGLQKYDRVAVLAYNTIHHVIAWLGTAKAGGIYLGLNYMLTGNDLKYCITHSESKFFIVEDTLYDSVKNVLGEMDTIDTLLWSMQDKTKTEIPANFHELTSWYNNASDEEPDVELHIEDPVQMSYTSGTESLPKCVLLNNQSLLAEYTGTIIDGDFSSDDINLNAMPIFHCAQRDVFLTPSLMVGCTNILIPRPDPETIMDMIDQYNVTMFFAPPTIWISLLRHPKFNEYSLRSLKKGYYGASIMPVEVLKELQNSLPNCQGFYNFYGQTELSPYHTILSPDYQISKAGSAGRSALHMETMLEDVEGNMISQTDSPGEICGRGPHVMLCYFKDPDKTEEVMLNERFHSGDIGILDEDNFITIVDRKKDMIKTGGENVPSREVEEVIYQHPNVSEVAVVGLPHEKWVEAVTAFIVPKDLENITADEIKDICQKNLASFKVPKDFIFIDELPKNPSGKLLKKNIRDQYKSYFSAQ